jgi:hypothetical protein
MVFVRKLLWSTAGAEPTIAVACARGKGISVDTNFHWSNSDCGLQYRLIRIIDRGVTPIAVNISVL